MDPAYPIYLNPKELALLGEITVILGQADDDMVKLAAHLLAVDRLAANRILGSSKVSDNTEIWAEIIRNRSSDEDVLWLVEHVKKEVKDVSESRNDFIHAVYETRLINVFNTISMGALDCPLGGVIESVARRVRKEKIRPVSELQEVRDRAARLSCLVAHVGHMASGNPATTSPWLQKVGQTLPPRLDTVAERKAKAHRHQRPPSPTLQQKRPRIRRKTLG